MHILQRGFIVKPKAGRHPQREPPKCDRMKLSTSTKLIIKKLTHILKEEINQTILISKYSYTVEKLMERKANN